MGRFIERSKGSVFIQTDPAEPYEFLTCIGVGNITVPRRSRTIKYEPDPMSAGDFKAAGTIKGEQGQVTATLTRPLETVNNYLLELDCDYQLRVNHPCRGDRTIVTNYEVAEMAFGAMFGSGEVEQPAIIDPADDERVMTNGEMSGLWYGLVYKLEGEQQEGVETTTNGNDIAFLPKRCADRCGPARGLGQIGYAALDSGGYLAGDCIIYTLDYGGTWTPTAADPWEGNRDANCVLLLELANGYRVLAGGGPDPGHDAEVSYSDAVANAAAGAVWNDVVVGTMNNQGINDLERDPLGRIYAAATAGMIYRSVDLGASWALIESGTTVEDVNGIAWYSESVGYAACDNNVVLRTVNGGTTWALVTGPSVGNNLMSVAVNHAGHVYVAVDDGTLYRSVDQGDNWDLVFDLGQGSINKIMFDQAHAYFGGLVWDTDAVEGYLKRSEDGGPSWDIQEYVTNSGLNSLWVCDGNLIYVIGNAHGGVTFIAQYHRVA
jgi:hypothetical protein